MELVIQRDAQPLYIVDSGYSPITEGAQLSEVVGQAEGRIFAGFADQEDQGVEEIMRQEA